MNDSTIVGLLGRTICASYTEALKNNAKMLGIGTAVSVGFCVCALCGAPSAALAAGPLIIMAGMWGMWGLYWRSFQAALRLIEHRTTPAERQELHNARPLLTEAAQWVNDL